MKLSSPLKKFHLSSYNPFRTAVPFGGQNHSNSKYFVPKTGLRSSKHYRTTLCCFPWNGPYRFPSPSEETAGRVLGSFLSESVFSIIFKTLGIIGDLHQYTEAFCHYSWNSPEVQKNKFVKFHTFGRKKQENMEDWKIERKKSRKIGKKSSPIRITPNPRPQRALERTERSIICRRDFLSSGICIVQQPIRKKPVLLV